jgi:hypothetical protein
VKYARMKQTIVFQGETHEMTFIDERALTHLEDELAQVQAKYDELFADYERLQWESTTYRNTHRGGEDV